MKIGLFTATFLDLQIEEVFKLASGLGYQAVEMPAFAPTPHLDIERSSRYKAAELKKMVSSYGLIISSLANHPEGRSSSDLTARIPTQSSRHKRREDQNSN